MKPFFLAIFFGLLYLPVGAQGRGEPCAARLIRSKPGNLQVIKSETIKSCVPAKSEVSIEDASITVGESGNRVKYTIQVKNLNQEKTIKAVEWRLDVYDEPRKNLAGNLYPSDNLTIKPNESGKADHEIAGKGSQENRLPRFAVILVQISKITYKDGSTYKPPFECKPNGSFDDVMCITPKEVSQ